MMAGEDAARAATDILNNVHQARHRLSMDSDLIICATSDGRALIWLDAERIGLSPLKGSLDGIVCHQSKVAASEMADHWNAAGGEPVDAINLNAGLCKAWGLVRMPMPNGALYV